MKEYEPVDAGLPRQGTMNEQLSLLNDACREKAVGFSCVYEEGSNTYYFTIDSCAESERFITKSGSFDSAFQSALQWVSEL